MQFQKTFGDSRGFACTATRKSFKNQIVHNWKLPVKRFCSFNSCRSVSLAVLNSWVSVYNDMNSHFKHCDFVATIIPYWLDLAHIWLTCMGYRLNSGRVPLIRFGLQLDLAHVWLLQI